MKTKIQAFGDQWHHQAAVLGLTGTVLYISNYAAEGQHEQISEIVLLLFVDG